MTLPSRIRAHKFARYWYCAEESKLRLEGVTPVYKPRPGLTAMEKGTNIDEWLRSRPRDFSEKIVTEKLEKFARENKWVNVDDFRGGSGTETYFPRTFEFRGDFSSPAGLDIQNIEIVAHPDDFTVVWRDEDVDPYEDAPDMRRLAFTQIIENKATDKLLDDGEYPPWKLAQARFQVELYGWVLRPILKEIGELMDKRMWVKVWRFNGEPLKFYPIDYPGDDYMNAQINTILRVWAGIEDPIIPQEWKCRVCNPAFKSVCPIALSNWTWGKRK